MTAGSTEAPGTGPLVSEFDTSGAEVATAGYLSIQGPAWQRYLAALAEREADRG